MISSGCAKSLAQNSLSLGYCTHTPHLDSVTMCVTAGYFCNTIHTHSTGIVLIYSDRTSHFEGQNTVCPVWTRCDQRMTKVTSRTNVIEKQNVHFTSIPLSESSRISNAPSGSFSMTPNARGVHVAFHCGDGDHARARAQLC